MLKIYSCLAIYWTIIFQILGADPYPRNTAIDIQHYRFTLDLNDSTNLIQGLAEVTILFKKSESSFELNLVGKSSIGKGMTVNSVKHNEHILTFSHKDDLLKINLDTPPQLNEQVIIVINYSGIPSDGLIISKNKFGDRTFFGDNWPDRAHYWLPTIDHPYDKASCEFIILAPSHYESIANGILVEKTNLAHNRILTHWKEEVSIPTKVMVIGVARFAKTLSGVVDGVPIETWVYPQNKEDGFLDFSMAKEITQYFANQIGPFPYKKLANVQSTTRFGGMENASNIFYFENSVNGKQDHESLIAHEIAHQWFGDSVSELDWYHVWLSEGFATYFANLYHENTYGRLPFESLMKTQRVEVVKYFKQNSAPVIDTTLVDIKKVLNTNSYQKGSWVLHMLRNEVGDEAFWSGIKSFYSNYQNGNAMTSDFRAIMEKASGKDLRLFFDQWLRKSGHPVLSGSWSFDQRKSLVTMKIKQEQATLYDTPLDIGLKMADGSIVEETIQLRDKDATFSFSMKMRPIALILDPNTRLLFEGEILSK